MYALASNPDTFTLAMDHVVSMRGPAFHYTRKSWTDPDSGKTYRRHWYRDPDCDPENPCGCLIGDTLTLLGWEYDPSVEGSSAYSLLIRLGLPEAYAWAGQHAQHEQDAARPFNEALSAYRNHLKFTGLDMWGSAGERPWELSK